jgi:putative transposase
MLFSAPKSARDSSTNKCNQNSGLYGWHRPKPHDFLVLANGGMENHAHLLIQLPPVMASSKAVALLKANSSKWMSEHGIRFSWQEGYGAFSVSASNIAAVTRYIEDQERHHRKMTFETEFVGLLTKHGVAFDPKYVFG